MPLNRLKGAIKHLLTIEDIQNQRVDELTQESAKIAELAADGKLPSQDQKELLRRALDMFLAAPYFKDPRKMSEDGKQKYFDARDVSNTWWHKATTKNPMEKTPELQKAIESVRKTRRERLKAKT